MSDLREQIIKALNGVFERRWALLATRRGGDPELPDASEEAADAILTLLQIQAPLGETLELPAAPVRTGGSVEELEALPDDSVVLAGGYAWQKIEGEWFSYCSVKPVPSADLARYYEPATVLTPATAPTVTAEQVEATLIREWHEDQCACRDFDGTDMATCYTRQTSKYGFVEPMTWTVEAVLRAASAKGDGK